MGWYPQKGCVVSDLEDGSVGALTESRPKSCRATLTSAPPMILVRCVVSDLEDGSGGALDGPDLKGISSGLQKYFKSKWTTGIPRS